jgi:hypothetical protein
MKAVNMQRKVYRVARGVRMGVVVRLMRGGVTRNKKTLKARRDSGWTD